MGITTQNTVKLPVVTVGDGRERDERVDLLPPIVHFLEDTRVVLAAPPDNNGILVALRA